MSIGIAFFYSDIYRRNKGTANQYLYNSIFEIQLTKYIFQHVIKRQIWVKNLSQPNRSSFFSFLLRICYSFTRTEENPDPYLTHFHSLTHNLYMTSQRAEKRDRERLIFLNLLKDLPTPLNNGINTCFQVFVAATFQTGLLCSAVVTPCKPDHTCIYY